LAIHLDGTDPLFNVFRVSAAQLAAAKSIIPDMPAGASALIDVAGASATFTNVGIQLGGTPAAQVLFSFCEATALTVKGVGIPASVLAPGAALQFDNGLIVGQVFVRSMAGFGQVNLAPFAGCLAIP